MEMEMLQNFLQFQNVQQRTYPCENVHLIEKQKLLAFRNRIKLNQDFYTT